MLVTDEHALRTDYPAEATGEPCPSTRSFHVTPAEGGGLPAHITLASELTPPCPASARSSVTHELAQRCANLLTKSGRGEPRAMEGT
jgi:hypothetical protein